VGNVIIRQRMAALPHPAHWLISRRWRSAATRGIVSAQEGRCNATGLMLIVPFQLAPDDRVSLARPASW